MSHYAKLPLTVEATIGESVTSLASRLALRNGAPRLASFCTDLGIHQQELMNGSIKTCGHIAGLAGHDAEVVSRWTPRFVQAGWFQLGSQRIKFTSFNRTKIRACPLCLNDQFRTDMNKGGHLGIWQLSSIRSCVVHHCELTHIPATAANVDLFDFARTSVVFKASTDSLKSVPYRSFENYLTARLVNDEACESWLDRLPFHVATQTAEYLGALVTLGPDAKREMISNSQWIAAGNAGYQILSHGPAALQEALKGMKAGHINDFGRYRARYRFFFDWLRFRDGDPAFDVIRDIVREYIWQNFPVAKGALVLGEKCPRQFVHSLSTASTSTGITRRQLGRHLSSMGLAKPNGKPLGYDLHDYVPDEIIQDIKSTLDTLLSHSEAASYLGIKRFMLSKLTRPDLIKVFSKDENALPRYAPSELARFMQSLEGLLEATKPTHGWVNIAKAAHNLNVQTDDVVSLISRHRMPLRSLHGEISSFRDFLINPGCLKHALKSTSIEAVHPSRAAKLLNLRITTVRKLQANGTLRSVKVKKSASAHLSKYVCPYSIDDFLIKFIPLRSLNLKSGFDEERLTEFKANLGIDTEPIYLVNVLAHLQFC